MTQTYTEDVIIDGTEDEVQLVVQGHSTQTEPLQEWQDSGGNTLAQISEDGRLQNGDIGLTTPDALIEAHRDSGLSLPTRGINTLGKVAGVISSALAWVFIELQLVGTAAISSIHAAVRGRLTHSSTGDSSGAELRAGDFEAINQSGTGGTPVGKAVGVQGTVDNQSGAYLTDASGVVAQIQNASDADIETARAIEVATPINDGTIDTLIGLDIPDIDQGTENYAIRTGAGIVYLGDVLELEQLADDPDDKADVVQFYSKDDKIFAKAPDPDNTVYDLTQGVGGGANLSIEATAGEALTANDAAYLNPSDNEIYLLDTDSGSIPINAVRGFVTGTVAADATATLQTGGTLSGFSGLTPGLPVYAGTTEGSITQTRPVPVKGGSQIAIVPMGVAISATEIHIQPQSVQYQLRDAMAEDDELTITHHSDEAGFLRRVRAYITRLLVGGAEVEYASSNQDTDVALRQREVATYTADQCSGGTASASSYYSGTFSPAKAVDNNNGTAWAANSETSGWWMYDFGSGVTKTIRRLTLRARNAVPEYTPKDFTIEYSNDGTNFTVVHAVSNQTGWTASQQRIYDFYNDVAARYWRISITALDGGTNINVGEFEMMEVSTYDDSPDKLAQTFNLAVSTEIGVLGLWLRRAGNPTGTLTVRIETTSSGEPTGTLAHANATTTLSEALLLDNYQERLIAFASSFTLSAGDYAIVLSTNRSASEENYVEWGADESSPGYSGGEMFNEVSATWSSEGKDAVFAIYPPGTERLGPVAVDSEYSVNADLIAHFADTSDTNIDTKTTFKCMRSVGFDDVTLVVELD